MSMSAKQRNLLITAGVAAGIALLIIILLLARGCDGEDVTTDTVKTATIATATTSTQEETAVEIISQSVTPDNVAEGSAISFTVLVRGNASTLTLTDELGPASSGGSFTQIFSDAMVKGQTSGDTTTWTLDTTASKVGRHRFYATATLGDGSTVMASGEPPTYLVAPPQSVPNPNPASTPLTITGQVANPGTISNGGLITFTVWVSGDPETVVMNWGAVGGDYSTNRVMQLTQTGTEPGGITVWQGSMNVAASDCSLSNKCYFTGEAFKTVNGQITSVKVPNMGEYGFMVNP